MNAKNFFLSLTFQFSFVTFFIRELLGGMLHCFGWVNKSVFPSQQHLVVVVQLLSRVWLFAPPWTAALPLFYTISQSLLKIMSIELMMLTISSSATSFTFQCSIFPSIRIFPKESLFISGGKSIGTSASASVLPMNI